MVTISSKAANMLVKPTHQLGSDGGIVLTTNYYTN